jgi:HSP20 family molecular chaperone IbpA
MLGELQPWFSGWPSADRFRRDMEELLDRFFSEDRHRSSNVLRPTWPAVESFVKGGNWVVRFDLPGVHPNDIDVSAVGDTLTIRASR